MNIRSPVEIPAAPPIRILHVLRSIDPAEGDQPRIAIRIAAEQVTAGHHVTVVTMDTAGVMIHAQRAFGDLPGYDRLRIYHSRDQTSLSFVLGSNAMQWLRPVLSNAGVLHLHGMWEALLHRAASLGRKKGIPVVVTPHTRRPAPAPSWLGRPLRGVLRMGWNGMLRQASMVHVMDGAEERLLADFGVRGNVRCISADADMVRRLTGEYFAGGEQNLSPAGQLAAPIT